VDQLEGILDEALTAVREELRGIANKDKSPEHSYAYALGVCNGMARNALNWLADAEWALQELRKARSVEQKEEDE